MSDKAQNKRDRHITWFIHKLLFRSMTTHRGWFVLTVTLTPLSFFIYHILVPLQVAYGVQSIITRNFDAISHHITILLVLAAIQAIVFTLATVAINRAGAIATGVVQRKVFTNFLDKDYDFYSDSYIGSLGAAAARLREAAFEYHHIVFFEAPKQATIVITGIIIIAFQSLPLALLTLASMFVVLSTTIATSAWRLKYRRLLGDASTELAGVMGDTLSHAGTVKSFASEEYEKKRLERSLRHWQKIQLKTWDSSIPSHTPRNFLNIIVICLLLAFTSTLYQTGSISIATVVLVQLYVIKLVAATLDIAEIVKLYETTMGAAYSPAKIMLVNSSIKDPLKPKKLTSKAAKTISFQNVSYSYLEGGSGRPAVNNFSLDISPGEKIGLIGHSGSGKTTLSKLLLRFMDVSEGSISIDGIDIRDITQHDLRSAIAYVPQEPLLFHRSIAENILYGRPEANVKELENVMNIAHVTEFVNVLPNGPDTIVGERGVKLSGGQRQRVAIARALLKNAPILMLDEATSALDSKSERYIQTALAKLMQNRATIVIAHRLSTIQRMDRIIVLDNGEIVQIGSHNELLKDKKGIYYNLWQHQSGGYLAISP